MFLFHWHKLLYTLSKIWQEVETMYGYAFSLFHLFFFFLDLTGYRNRKNKCYHVGALEVVNLNLHIWEVLVWSLFTDSPIHTLVQIDDGAVWRSIAISFVLWSIGYVHGFVFCIFYRALLFYCDFMWYLNCCCTVFRYFPLLFNMGKNTTCFSQILVISLHIIQSAHVAIQLQLKQPMMLYTVWSVNGEHGD